MDLTPDAANKGIIATAITILGGGAAEAFRRLSLKPIKGLARAALKAADEAKAESMSARNEVNEVRASMMGRDELLTQFANITNNQNETNKRVDALVLRFDNHIDKGA